MLMYLSIFSTNDDHDEEFLYNFADINVLAELKRINGVGYADILGAKEYAMRVWLKPDKLVAYQVSADDVLDALERSNVEAAPGKIGENSDRSDNLLQYTIKYTGKFSTVEQYEIGGAIIAITLVMSSVFVPMAFIGGPSGVFYRQFALTMAISIVLSGVLEGARGWLEVIPVQPFNRQGAACP